MPISQENGRLTNKILTAVAAAIITGLLSFAYARLNTITSSEAAAAISESETRVNARVDTIEASHRSMDQKLDKLSEDVARINAQVEILLKR